MRLAVFTSQFPSVVNTFFVRDIRSLLEAGVEVDVFPIYPLDTALWRWVPSILSESVFPRNRVHHAKWSECLLNWRPWSRKRALRFLKDVVAISCSAIRFGITPLAKSLYVMPIAWDWARKYEGRYDHILSYWGNYAATCAFVANRLQPHPVPFSFLLHAGTDLYRDQVYLREKLLQASSVFVVCDFNREFIAQNFPGTYSKIAHKVHLHRLGLDFSELIFKAGGRIPNSVIAVGRFDRRKGFDFLLRAAARVRANGRLISVKLVGDGPEAENLHRLGADLGLSNCLSFTGWRSFSEVRDLIQGSAILVHPSPEIGDAVPTVIKEAMALGTPVVGSKVAGIPELLDNGRCGCLVPPRDVQSLANAIERLLGDESLRFQYSLDGRRHAESTLDLWANGQRLATLLAGTTRS